MIRDFWEIRKRTLYDEIQGLKDKVSGSSWRAIDAVREIGNIGAHMEKDVDVIIDVEPEEAGLLLRLIEKPGADRSREGQRETEVRGWRRFRHRGEPNRTPVEQFCAVLKARLRKGDPGGGEPVAAAAVHYVGNILTDFTIVPVHTNMSPGTG